MHNGVHHFAVLYTMAAHHHNATPRTTMMADDTMSTQRMGNGAPVLVQVIFTVAAVLFCARGWCFAMLDSLI